MAAKSLWRPPLIFCEEASFKLIEKNPQKQNQVLSKPNHLRRRRRGITMVGLVSILLGREACLKQQIGYALDLRLVAPDQTLEEAETEIRGHAQALMEIKGLIDSKSWKETQKALRTASSYLKQDVYTIIQGKPVSERAQLRKLYSNLFNNVTKLDYAARDKDESLVLECYHNIVVALNQILSMI
ncbi:hypothetical protein UlMin_004924 [Ulmus minor]